jgi:hypothetical protein
MPVSKTFFIFSNLKLQLHFCNKCKIGTYFSSDDLSCQKIGLKGNYPFPGEYFRVRNSHNLWSSHQIPFKILKKNYIWLFCIKILVFSYCFFDNNFNSFNSQALSSVYFQLIFTSNCLVLLFIFTRQINKKPAQT